MERNTMSRLLHSRWLVRTFFAATLVVATWPAWRVALLGAEPTLTELLQLICVTPPPEAAVSAGATGRR
jgi:hypothetical protein